MERKESPHYFSTWPTWPMQPGLCSGYLCLPLLTRPVMLQTSRKDFIEDMMQTLTQLETLPWHDMLLCHIPGMFAIQQVSCASKTNRIKASEINCSSLSTQLRLCAGLLVPVKKYFPLVSVYSYTKPGELLIKHKNAEITVTHTLLISCCYLLSFITVYMADLQLYPVNKMRQAGEDG